MGIIGNQVSILSGPATVKSESRTKATGFAGKACEDDDL